MKRHKSIDYYLAWNSPFGTKARPLRDRRRLPMVTAIVTFANRRLAHMHGRFRRQVRKFGEFDRAYIWTEKNLDHDFKIAFGHLLKPEVPGYGFWVWKPQVILQALELLKEGDVLVYLDSGSHLNSGGKVRFFEYLTHAKLSETGILAFELELIEAHWTKGDLLDFYGVRGKLEVVNSCQIQAGAVIIEKRPDSIRFIREWLAPFALDAGLVDNSPSKSTNEPGFRAHRNDQSVFSIIGKSNNISILSASEQYPSRAGATWEDLNSMPFHHRRDKTTVINKLFQWVAESSVPFQVFLVKIKASLRSN